MDTIEAYRTKYEQAGIETMPIPYKHKAPPLVTGWYSTSSFDLWRLVRTPTNLAVIAGRKGLNIIDSDNHATVEAVDNYLAGLGIPQVGTISKRGGHRYVRSDFGLDKAQVKLKQPLKGELRLYHTYALAEPSVVQGFEYEQVGDLALIPWVESRDIRELIDISSVDTPLIQYGSPPVPIVRREPKRWVRRILEYLPHAEKGKQVQLSGKYYSSRSESVIGVMESLILSGCAFDEISSLFDGLDLEWNVRWYECTYANALNWLCNSEYRKILELLFNLGMSISTRSGKTDLLVYKSCVAHAWMLGSTEVYLPSREIAQFDRPCRSTVQYSLKRLVKLGVLSVDYPVFAPRRNTSGIYSFDLSILSSKVSSNIHSSINILNNRCDIWPSLPKKEFQRRKLHFEKDRISYSDYLSSHNLYQNPSYRKSIARNK